MRTPLPGARANGHTPVPERIFIISGMCSDPHFRLRSTMGGVDFCLIYLGAPGFGEGGEIGGGEIEESAGEPYFVLRRTSEAGAVVVVLRVDWEGIFTVFANDDGAAEAVFDEIVLPGAPEEISRQWSQDVSTLRMFGDLSLLQ